MLFLLTWGFYKSNFNYSLGCCTLPLPLPPLCAYVRVSLSDFLNNTFMIILNSVVCMEAARLLSLARSRCAYFLCVIKITDI
jgi:hypothetical protein